MGGGNQKFMIFSYVFSKQQNSNSLSCVCGRLVGYLRLCLHSACGVYGSF
jgi:hypothetical protein